MVICSPKNNTGAQIKKRNFSPEFKRKSAQLVVNQNYTAKAMDVGLFTITRWVKQLRDERQVKTPKAPHNSGTNRNTRAKEKATTN